MEEVYYMSKIIEINGTVFSRHVDKDITEEEFFDAFSAFLDANDYLFGGGWEETDDDDE